MKHLYLYVRIMIALDYNPFVPHQTFHFVLRSLLSSEIHKKTTPMIKVLIFHKLPSVYFVPNNQMKKRANAYLNVLRKEFFFVLSFIVNLSCCTIWRNYIRNSHTHNRKHNKKIRRRNFSLSLNLCDDRQTDSIYMLHAVDSNKSSYSTTSFYSILFSNKAQKKYWWRKTENRKKFISLIYYYEKWGSEGLEYKGWYSAGNYIRWRYDDDY